MEYLLMVLILLIIIVVLKLGFDVKISEIKKAKEIGFDSELNKKTQILPRNVEVCHAILKMLHNENIVVEENNTREASLYLVLTNKILIADISKTFTRIQTIAHECVHSIQNKAMLYFNFIFSNIYILYFVIISVLTLFHVVHNSSIYLMILILLTLVFYAVRSFLETDAMTRARYVAKEYMEQTKLMVQTDIDEVIENYDILNKIGIPLTQFVLLINGLGKVILYCLIAYISTLY